MQVVVTFRHVEPTDGLRSYAESKVQRVHKFLRNPIDAHIVLAVEKQRHIAEVLVNASHLNVSATEETGDLYSAIDLAMDKIERQIKRHAEKHKAHKGPGPAETLATTSRADDHGADDRGSVRVQRVAIKPMSVDEAVLQLKMAKSDFLLFQNDANDILSVLYRRKDGNFGLIEPEPA